jgi:hypothetical protein
MTNEELDTIKSKLESARSELRAAMAISDSLSIIDNVQKRAIMFGRGPDCYNCDCKVKCERYAQR